LFGVGISYRNASVAIREQAALTVAQQTHLYTLIAAHNFPTVNELVILSTCNRTELYALAEEDNAADALITLWSQFTNLPTETLRSLCYVLNDDMCVCHLLEVSAGLDSQVIGEPQILGQVSDAYERAKSFGAAGSTLSALLRTAIQTGKRVRNETALSAGTLSISSVAASHSRQIFGDLSNATVLIVGTGEMARAAVSSLVRQNADKLLIANHNLDHASAFAAEWGGEIVPYTQLGQALARADLVITAVAAPHPILHAEDIASIAPTRGARPLLIFDIALPRNVEPEVGEMAGVRLYNLDDLQAVTDAHYNVRQAALPEATLIVTEELNGFQQWQASRAAVPTIQHLRGKADQLRQSELEALFHRLPDLDDHSRKVIEEFSRRLINKMLHQPTLTLKEKSAAGEADLYASVLDELFRLSED
jgi:glutamyl-tRNA reductase